MAETRQTRLGRRRLNIYERFREKHGAWYDKVMKAEEERAGIGKITAFSLERATTDQEDAIRTYMKQEGYQTLAGFLSYMRWSETTFYDILRIVSP